MADKNQLDDILKNLSQRLNTSPEDLKNSLNNGKVDKLFNKMDSKDAEKIKNILNDKEASEKILSSPQAQAIIKKLMS